MHHHLQAALDAVESAAGSLPTAVISRPVPGRWCVGEILEHLTLAFTANAAVFEKALASDTLKVRQPNLRQRVGRVVVIGFGYFPRVETPESTRPRGSIAAGRSVESVREALMKLDDVMNRVVVRFGEDVPAANHPYFMGLTVRQWRKFHWRHTVHHMRQVKERCAMISTV
jgi:hypothetical protein